jgi:hypothetical protein
MLTRSEHARTRDRLIDGEEDRAIVDLESEKSKETLNDTWRTDQPQTD